MPVFDAIIFDCDGVIVDSELLSCECLAQLFTERGMPMTIGFVYQEFLGRSFANVEAYYERVAGKSFPSAFREEYRARLLERFRMTLKPMPGVATLLSGLRVPFCLASSSDRERLGVTLAATHLASYFDGRVFDATMVKNGKPAPDLFLFCRGGDGRRSARLPGGGGHGAGHRRRQGGRDDGVGLRRRHAFRRPRRAPRTGKRGRRPHIGIDARTGAGAGTERGRRLDGSAAL
ncbi:MAG: HAD family hydrolase [Bauldia sp.]